MKPGTISAQARALRAYRQRLRRTGMARFEVLGRAEDRALLRDLARILTGDDASAQHVRTELRRMLAPAQPPGGILDAFLRSPWAGANLTLNREWTSGRDLEL